MSKYHHMDVCMCVCLSTHSHTHIYIYIHMHPSIHTYIHILTEPWCSFHISKGPPLGARPSRTRQDSEDTEQVRDSESGPESPQSFPGWDLFDSPNHGTVSVIKCLWWWLNRPWWCGFSWGVRNTMARRKGRWVTERFRLVKKIILSGKNNPVDWLWNYYGFRKQKLDAPPILSVWECHWYIHDGLVLK